MNDGGLERFGSPRPETPEPGSRQGRRNAQPGPQLLDDEGCISEQVRSSARFGISAREDGLTRTIFIANTVLETHLCQG